MSATENILLKHIAAELSCRFGTGCLIHEAVPLAGGSIHRALKLATSAGNFFLKWSLTAAADIFIREAESLQILQSVQPEPLVIPSVVGVGAVGEQPGFLLLDYLEPDRVSNCDAMLGRGLAALHLHPGASEFGFFHNNYCGATEQDNRWSTNWAEFYAHQRVGSLISRLSRTKRLSSFDREMFNRFIIKLPQLLPDGQRPSLIHGDLWSGNCMNTSSGPALIDPAAYYADHEMELGIMSLFGGFSDEFWEGYHEMFPPAPDWQARVEIYQVYHLLNHHLLFGGSYLAAALRIVRRYV